VLDVRLGGETFFSSFPPNEATVEGQGNPSLLGRNRGRARRTCGVSFGGAPPPFRLHNERARDVPV
jgi:hypothetical protein